MRESLKQVEKVENIISERLGQGLEVFDQLTAEIVADELEINMDAAQQLLTEVLYNIDPVLVEAEKQKMVTTRWR